MLKKLVMGECKVFVTKLKDGWHLSIGHRTRYPTQAEIDAALAKCIPKDVYMHLIPIDQTRWMTPVVGGVSFVVHAHEVGSLH